MTLVCSYPYYLVKNYSVNRICLALEFSFVTVSYLKDMKGWIVTLGHQSFHG
jgi:hypothetical protein